MRTVFSSARISAASTGTGADDGDDGLEASGVDNTVSNNSFEDNGDWNICVGPGTTDGGGNREPPFTFRLPLTVDGAVLPGGDRQARRGAQADDTLGAPGQARADAIPCAPSWPST